MTVKYRHSLEQADVMQLCTDITLLPVYTCIQWRYVTVLRYMSVPTLRSACLSAQYENLVDFGVWNKLLKQPKILPALAAVGVDQKLKYRSETCNFVVHPHAGQPFQLVTMIQINSQVMAILVQTWMEKDHTTLASFPLPGLLVSAQR